MSVSAEELIDARIEERKGTAKQASQYRVVSTRELLAHRFSPREMLLAPWLPAQGLAMIYAPRGIGKTHAAMWIGYVVASGSEFLGWSAPSPRGVLYIDGEMPGVVLQERLSSIVSAAEREVTASLEFLTPDLQECGTPNLADPVHQQQIEPLLADKSLVIVDNISTLCHGGKENEAEGWLPIQGWALRQRAAGRSVLFIHHAGKGGAQRGTSRREDVLDTVINLKRPGDYQASEGARFIVEFEKCRSFHGDDATPFEARLSTTPEGIQRWNVTNIEESTFDQVVARLRDKIPQAEIARELGVNPSTVSRHVRRAREERLVR